LLGEDTEEVLGKMLKLSPDEIQQLRDAGAV
jgi:crotonobetainyl-CoA:carnitine CoA-transferase CaiB-like acyl-CoA transferase